jgi:hypothetical protein
MPNPPVSFIIKGFLNDFSNQKNTQKNIRQIKSARTIIFYFQFESYPSDPIKKRIATAILFLSTGFKFLL